MAVDTKGGHPAMDYPEHVRTYRRFLKGSKWLTIALGALLIFMAFYLL